MSRDIHAQLTAVTRIYPGAGNQPPVEALGPVDLGLRKGEFFAVVGPSGCGKSTFLDVLAGLQTPTSGTVTFEGKPVRGEVAEGIGVVFQEDASFPWLTVWDNAAFGLRRNGVREAEIKRRVDDALYFMGLKDFARANKFDEVAVALSIMCDLPIEVVERGLVQDRSEVIVVLARAAGLDWDATRAILQMEARSGAQSRQQLWSRPIEESVGVS